MTTEASGVAAGAMPPRSAAIGERRWYVIYSRPRKESWATFQLQLRGVEVFYPRLRLPEFAASPRHIVPLFPNYLFVRIDLHGQFYDVIWSPGVRRFVGPEGVPAALDDAVVAFLRSSADADGVVAARSRLQVGQEAEITRGPFAGLVGIIERPPDARGRVRVLMQLLNRRVVRVHIPLEHVKSDWVV